jgi:hypothetical protein
MPEQRRPGSILDAATASSPRGNFRQRYADVEARRAELIARLRKLSTGAQAHPGYKRALTLLNDTFRKSRLAQRLAVLQAAAWLIDILERLTSAI